LTTIVTRILLAVAGALLALPASMALAQTPPVNDNYFDSLRLNAPGERLERTDTLRDQRDTTAATVQGDVLTPGPGGGPPELTRCGQTSYGNTIWYDVYPDVQGLLRLRASGYDTVISVIPFSRTTLRPDFDRAICIDDSSSTTEELLAEVAKGRAYTIQIGGANGASGVVEFLFDFLADRDGDEVLDDADDCPTLAGTRRNGCPVELKVRAKITARVVPGGLEVLALTVTAPRGSRVAASCSRGCRPEVRRAKSTVRLRRVRGRRLSVGTTITIRVTRRRAIGSYIRFRVGAGNVQRTERCMNPGSRKPRRKCG
jgi:hypothetical protein